jgi:RimJ/RimL family protein N-acetyltransferase
MVQAKADGTLVVVLRAVQEDDLPAFFEHQNDPDAATMAGFPTRELPAFMAHWQKVLQDPTNVNCTIVVNDEVVGNIASFVQDGQREVGYWIGRAFWGKGVATAALRMFLADVEQRQVHAYAVKQNIGSLRVLQKCGFTVVGEDEEGFILERSASMPVERS